MIIVESISWLIVFIISVTIHEAAHAWAAKKGGDLTAYQGGQVSLNPIPHIKREPLGMIVFPLISSLLFGWPFGYASSPYNPYWAYEHPRKAALMATAGPISNIFIVLLCTIIIKGGILIGVFTQPYSIGFQSIVVPASGGIWTGLSVFVSMLFTLNLVMAVLNLIPLPPLDGSNIISLFLRDAAARKYRSIISNPIFGFLGFLIAWHVFSPLFIIIFRGAINTLY